jgi:hypothetical protein
MIPLFAVVALNPLFPVHLCILVVVLIDLAAVVTMLLVVKQPDAYLTELDLCIVL